MAAVFHRQTEPYSSHEAGDSIYDHSGEKVKTSVLGFAIALTLGFSAIELVAGWLGNSLALVGDAGHMVTDSMSLLFALVANIFSRHGADEDHSFGHGRLEALAAFVNGIVMSGVIVWIVIEAGKRMMNPEPVSGGSVMMVATIGLIVNVGVAWSLSRDKKNVNTRAALVHVMGDLRDSRGFHCLDGRPHDRGPAALHHCGLPPHPRDDRDLQRVDPGAARRRAGRRGVRSGG